MAIHNVSGKANFSLNNNAVNVSPQEKLWNILHKEENKHLSSMFYLGGLTRLYEDYDLIRHGIELAEEAMANGDKLQDADPAGVIKQGKVELNKVKHIIELVLKSCNVDFEVEESLYDEPEANKE